MAARTQFYIDRQNKKISGVCAGISDYTGLDVTIVRIAMLALLWATGGVILLGYWATAHLAPEKPHGLYQDADDQKFWQGVRSNPARTSRDVRAKMRDIDRRLADLEIFYTSRNSSLADEIEALR